MKIIGRKRQQAELNSLLASNKPEFAVVYGRRRVGKTYLIKEYFNNRFAFYHTGLANGSAKKQLRNFQKSLELYGRTSYPKAEDWLDAFSQLRQLLEMQDSPDGKRVVFIDETPWIDTRRSDFVSALEHFWNSWASSQPNILLILCGAATSWIISKIMKNHGGLHNRVTQKIMLEPFTLAECESFFAENNMEATRHQILEYYMILGGIPFYLDLIKKQYSVVQNIDLLFFANNAVLKDEFENLYASLFANAENYMRIAETLAVKNKGLTRKELIGGAKILDGAGTARMLEELEQCGFIRKYHAFGKTSRESVYQLVDFFTLFYFRFIKNTRHNDEHLWEHLIDNQRHRAWTGFAFELVCLSHLQQIKAKLGIAGVLTSASVWQSKNSENGAQIDLVIDRNDKVVNLCEIKFYNDQLVIDKDLNADLRRKKQVFKDETKTRKSVHTTLISAYGIKPNACSRDIQSEVTMDDLFEL
ncbi:MAG: ATP-binding protein [Prevotellaceae bacterium]|jgi:AAA+ ATPase superfamily predicted ATPase|nr:ATP-binding protein [Prevotellaceae bacterium]